MIYSKSTGGFYDQSINGDSIPADSVEITPEEYADLLDKQSAGKRIIADAKGFPIAVDPPELSAADLAAAARKWRNAELIIADIEIRKHEDSDPKAYSTIQAWRDYRIRLRDWPESESFPKQKPTIE